MLTEEKLNKIGTSVEHSPHNSLTHPAQIISRMSAQTVTTSGSETVYDNSR
jgi:hypothetical protein